ncbi:hypothetical protein SAMN05421740_11475 [Parapedobacter koreensis]|uniref:Uncharacterized protein n=2 Tax=Parapedobacter koreensis TaxID=332977 RepID=A0A1H7UC14_9SPHI|nr:hypothetical protein SAMN05421740_11475 [Parapedobacter koreensis]
MKTAIVFALLVAGWNVSPCQTVLQTLESDSVLEGYIADMKREISLERPLMNTQKIYRIWTGFQVVELELLNDSSVNGRVVNFIAKNDKKGIKKKLLSDSRTISQKTVSRLIEDLNTANIEEIKDATHIPGYPIGFDGTQYIFEVFTNNRYRLYAYWEPLNDHYAKPDVPDVANVRKILHRLHEELGLWESFITFRDSLPPGNYSYGGINMIKLKDKIN